MFVIRSQRLAGYLMLRGFVLRGLSVDRSDRKRNVFIFVDTPQLHDAIGDYREESSKRRMTEVVTDDKYRDNVNRE